MAIRDLLWACPLCGLEGGLRHGEMGGVPWVRRPIPPWTWRLPSSLEPRTDDPNPRGGGMGRSTPGIEEYTSRLELTKRMAFCASHACAPVWR